MRFSALPLLAVLLTTSCWAQNSSTNVKGVSSRQVDGSPQEWQPLGYRNEIGYEAPTTGPFKQNTISFSMWWSQLVGADFMFGYSKSSNSTSTSETISIPDTTSTTGSETDTISNGGVVSPSYLTLAIRPKYKMYMNNWIQVYAGFLLGMTSTGSVSYPTGTQTTTYANRSIQNTYSVSQSNYGTTSNTVSTQIFYGPCLGSEFYLKWIPHLALGFSTGIYMTTGGDTTSSTNYSSQAYTVTNGVAATPTSGSSATYNSSTKVGSSSNTYGAGGTLFSLFSTAFTVRYVW